MNEHWLFLIIPASTAVGVFIGVYAIVKICNALTRRQ